MAQTREQMSKTARVILILKRASCRDRRHETLAQKMATTMARPATDVKEPVSKKKYIERDLEEDGRGIDNAPELSSERWSSELPAMFAAASGPSPPFEV